MATGWKQVSDTEDDLIKQCLALFKSHSPKHYPASYPSDLLKPAYTLERMQNRIRDKKDQTTESMFELWAYSVNVPPSSITDYVVAVVLDRSLKRDPSLVGQPKNPQKRDHWCISIGFSYLKYDPANPAAFTDYVQKIYDIVKPFVKAQCYIKEHAGPPPQEIWVAWSTPTTIDPYLGVDALYKKFEDDTANWQNTPIIPEMAYNHYKAWLGDVIINRRRVKYIGPP